MRNCGIIAIPILVVSLVVFVDLANAHYFARFCLFFDCTFEVRLLLLDFPTFISECGFGGIRRSAPTNRFVAAISNSAMAKPIYQLASRYQDPKHWTRGQKSKNPAKYNKLIHVGVGHALSNWEHVEAAAAMLFSHFVNSTSIAALRAYGTINGTRAREAALKQAAETFFALRKHAYKKDRKVYDDLKIAEKCTSILIHNYGAASGRRNDIAHGIAWELSAKEQDEQAWYLVAPNYNSPKTKNWIEDDFGLRSAKGLSLRDPKARFDYNKFYYKNSEYVFGPNELKTFAGKFAYLYAEMLSFAHVMEPNKFRIAPAVLTELAKHLSS